MNLGHQVGAIVADSSSQAFAQMVEIVSDKIKNGDICCSVDTVENVISFYEESGEKDSKEIIDQLSFYRESLQEELKLSQEPCVSAETLLRMNIGMVKCK